MMIQLTYFIMCVFLFLSCASGKKTTAVDNLKDVQGLPLCIDSKIKSMSADPNEGSPISVTAYNYKGKIVYYMVSPCCDKYNVVYDSVCNILGYPDGGFTGRGDGKMPDFRKEATDNRLIWEAKKGL